MSEASVVLLTLCTVASTVAGGLFALKLQRLLRYILAFSAGVLVGVVSFDILPEVFALAHAGARDPLHGMVALVIGFLAFHTIEELLVLHEHGEVDERHIERRVGVLSALALAGHSFMDGVAIGLGFQVSNAVGVAVLIAVVSHDFCDGINTVSLMLLHRNPAGRSLAMLALDALAPLAGAALSFALAPPPYAMMLYLGFFAGFLLYIGAADILPEAYANARSPVSYALIALTAFGAAFIYFASRLADSL
jgi:ZIP family zinc transporter